MNYSKFLFIGVALLAVILFTTSCGTRKKELPVISIEKLVKNELSLSDIAEEVKYLALDDSIMLSKIWKVQKAKTGYFIKTNDGLFHFSNDGDFKYQIGKQGKGPGEYVYVEDFTIDCKNQLIYILGVKRVHVFNFQGAFLRSFPTIDELRFHQIDLKNDNLYFPTGIGFELMEQKWEWFKTDLDGTLIHRQQNVIEDFKPVVWYRSKLCFEKDNDIFYWNQLNDTIFKINAEIEPAFLFAKDKNRITKSDFSSADNFRNKPSWQLISVLGASRFLILEYILIKDGKRIYTVFDTLKNSLYELNSTELSTDLQLLNSFDGGPCFMPKSKISINEEDWFVNWIDAFHLKGLTNSEAFKNSTPKYPKKKKALEKLAISLNENDNPVLMLVKLKEKS